MQMPFPLPTRSGLWRAILLLLVCLILPAMGQESAADLTAQVEAKLAEKVDEELAPLVRAACQKLGIAYPPAAPELSIADVEQKIDEVVDKAIAERLPANREATYRAEAAKLFAPYKLREEVTVTLASGQTVTGVLYANNQYYVQVSSQRISKGDLAAESRARFDEADSKRAQEVYVKRKMLVDENVAERLRREKRAQLEGRIYAQHGYRKHDNRWIPIVDLIDAALARKRLELKANHQEWAENQVYINSGYIKIDGEWRLLDEVAEERRRAALGETAPAPAAVEPPPAEAAPPADDVPPAEAAEPATTEPQAAPDIPATEEQPPLPAEPAIAVPPPMQDEPPPAPGTFEDPFINTPEAPPEIPDEKVRPIGEGFGDTGFEADFDEMGEDPELAETMAGFGLLAIAMRVAIYLVAAVVATLALFFAGSFVGTETSFLHCLMAGASAQVLTALWPGSLMVGLASSGVTFGVLWYTDRSAGTGSLISQVLIANILVKLLIWGVMILFAMLLAGQMLGAMAG